MINIRILREIAIVAIERTTVVKAANFINPKNHMPCTIIAGGSISSVKARG